MGNTKILKRRMKILASEFGMEIKSFSEAIGVSYQGLIAINLANRGIGPTVIKAINKYISRVKPGFKLNVFFFFDQVASPFIKDVTHKGIVDTVKPDHRSINKRLKEVRVKSGLTQKEFAKAVKFSEHQIHAIEYSRGTISLDFLINLKKYKFIDTYDEFIDGVKSTNDKETAELKNRIDELQDDILMFKVALKKKLKS